MPHNHHPTTRVRSLWPRVGTALVALLLLALVIQPVQALAYYFRVADLTVDVFANADGTVSIDYDYVFENQPSGEPIEYVDIGMPTTSYDMNSITATVNGQPAEGIEPNSDVKGISVYLGSKAIPSGEKGEVRVHIGQVNRMLFKSSQKEAEAYGSFHFMPNYFGSQYVAGQTNMTVTLHLPPGVKPEEPRYIPPTNWPGSSDPETGMDENGRAYYRWTSANADASAQYDFGATFPARLVPAGALLTPLPNINFDALCPWIFCIGIVGFFAVTITSSVAADRKRRLKYLPPRVAVEGNGIKRGLTAVEAALLMEQPMDKILTMILFSVVKKGAATVVSRDPMKIQVTDQRPEGLQTYEEAFLDAMAMSKAQEQRRALQDLMVNLVKSVSEKMRGFSRRDTVAYYTDIMNKAWQQVEQANTPEMKMQAFDEAMDWTMLDRRYQDRTRDTFGPRPVVVPMWWGRFDPGFGRATASTSGPSIPHGSAGNNPPQGLSLPNLPGADMAAGMAMGVQNFANTVVGDLTSFTGGITDKTNPVPKAPTTTYRGGGGGGGGGRSCACACACACAGCACACAGGGR